MKISKVIQRHTEYYLKLMRFYNRKKLNWKSSQDKGQIDLALERSRKSSKM